MKQKKDNATRKIYYIYPIQDKKVKELAKKEKITESHIIRELINTHIK